MSSTAHSSIIPCLCYHDAPAALRWLCAVFGFTPQLVVPDADGKILHAQLSLNGGMVMVGSHYDNAYGRLMREPAEVGGNTQSLYVVAAEVDALYARVQAQGGDIVLPLKDESYGGRGFTCRDPEGHLWSVGSYDPWAPPAEAGAGAV